MENKSEAKKGGVGAAIGTIVLAAACAAGGWIAKGLFPDRPRALPQMPQMAATVAVREVEEREYNLPEKFVAHAEAMQEVDLLPQVDGYVKEIRFKEGDIVKAGSVLYVLDDERYRAVANQRKADLEAAEAEARRAVRYWERMQSADERGITQLERDNAEAANDSAAAAVLHKHGALGSGDLGKAEVGEKPRALRLGVEETMAAPARKLPLQQVGDDLVQQPLAAVPVRDGEAAQSTAKAAARGDERAVVIIDAAGVVEIAVAADALALEQGVHLLLRPCAARRNFADHRESRSFPLSYHKKTASGSPKPFLIEINQMGMMPMIAAKIMHRMENTQTYRKDDLMWSLMSTSARPVPSRVAGTIGLMNVAQLRHTTMAIAMGSA